MNIKYIKQLSLVASGLFLIGMTSVFGQTLDPAPASHSVTTDKTLYELGYTSKGAASADEATDEVTVGSTMPYFIMPDQYLNTDYFAQSNYALTNLTKSTFTWAVSTPANGTVTPQAVNSTGTSPWVKIKWNTTGTVNVTMKEQQGMSCESDAVTIPVKVVKVPEIMFADDSNGRMFIECVPGQSSSYVFTVAPVTGGNAISESTDVRITYDLTFSSPDGATQNSSSGTASVTGTAFTIPMTAWGFYTVKITGVSDMASRKSVFDGTPSMTLGNIPQTTFVYAMLPKPALGKAYHIPNN